ncbi:hypothetical protein [Halegenticoccus tardaugens]|uniref:hypothetical protein n=1 Tax=Halegenticoccus tardaugens TaxID=2071624 RepID=UPI00100B9E67|nr:hypothetical protein [Halegenticoccus tardaugens]
MSDGQIQIEILVADDADERLKVESNSRIDVSVNGRMYPTAKLDDERYVAWWFDAVAPEPDDPATTEWVVAPTRYLAAATLGELWNDPTAFHALTQ